MNGSLEMSFGTVTIVALSFHTLRAKRRIIQRPLEWQASRTSFDLNSKSPSESGPTHATRTADDTEVVDAEEREFEQLFNEGIYYANMVRTYP